MNVPFTGEVWTYYDGEWTQEDKIQDFSWMKNKTSKEILLAPADIEDFALVTSDVEDWEETEEDLDYWVPLPKLPQWFVNDVAQECNHDHQKMLRQTFWLWFNRQKPLFIERLRRGDRNTVDHIIDVLGLYDWGITEYSDRHSLFRDPPSFTNELEREITQAMDRDHTIAPISKQLAMGEMVKVNIKGITHIIPYADVEEAGATHLIVE
jgi:hypothetical protein